MSDKQEDDIKNKWSGCFITEDIHKPNRECVIKDYKDTLSARTEVIDLPVVYKLKMKARK